MPITHDFVSAKADGADTSVVRPSDWNHDHTVSAWDDLRVELTKTTATGAPTFEQWFTNGSASAGVFLHSFTDESVAGNEKQMFFCAQMPHDWDGGAIYPHLHWLPNASATAKAVRWGLEYNWAEPGADFGNTSIIYATGRVPNDANFTAKRHYIATFDALTPTTSQDGLSSIIIGRIFRNSSNVADNYTDKAGVMYFDIHYRRDSVGSTTEYTK